MKLLLLIALLIFFGLVHVVKMMRLYLIIMERQIPFERFVPAYFRTTLVNLIVPFKLGEIYRVIVLWRLSKGFKTGFFSVVVDRFFDTLAIVCILLPYQIFVSRMVTIPVLLLTVFLAVIVIFYVIFPSSYSFLNRYIIMTKSSKRSLTVLKWLEVVHDWYEYVRNLVIGRYGLLILLSLAAWILEIFVLMGFSKFQGLSFKVADFGQYIESIVSGSTYALSKTYGFASIVIILIATCISTIVYCFRRRVSNDK